MSGVPLDRFPIHLGRGGSATCEPEFTGMEWYEAYSARHAGDGAEGRLVSFYRFDESWAMWEMHPHGSEVVLCLSGRIMLHQQLADGTEQSFELGAGDYAINPPGAWHTADISDPASALFITSGEGTQHRPR